MATPGLIQIVPTLRPPAEGVGELALALAEVLEARSGVSSRFVVGRTDWAGPEDGSIAALPLTERTAEAFVDTVRSMIGAESGRSAVLLHYSGYGYHPRGRPTWLADGVERLRRTCFEEIGPMVTVFHEVYADGAPWTRAFWDSRRQRAVARRLLEVSEAAVTSLELYARMLRPWADNRPVEVLPIPSTVGEPDRVLPLAERAPRMVVFGGEGNRRRVYRNHGASLEAARRALGVEEIVDVGPGSAAADAGPPVRTLGLLPGAELREVLLGARAGCLAYPPAFFPKSTVFAAYAAHGLLPIALGDDHHPLLGGLTPGVHFLRAASGPVDRARQQVIASAAHDWYHGHDLDRHARLYLRLLGLSGGPS